MKRLVILFALTVCCSPGENDGHDPFSAGPDKGAATFELGEEFVKSTNVDLVVEVFALSAKEAAALRRREAGDVGLYQAMLANKTVELEMFQSVVSRPGQEVMVEDIREFIYPTEFEPAEGFENPPNMLVYDEGYAPPGPSAFDVKNLGTSLFVRPLVLPGSGLMELEVSFWQTDFQGLERWGVKPSITRMPHFGSSSIKSGISVRSGAPALMGTMKGEDGEVKLAFVTATVSGEILKHAEDDSVRLTYEVFSLPVTKAARLRRDGEKLYQRVVAGLQEGGVVQEKYLCLRCVSGWNATLQEVTEMIYPSEYNPPGFQYDLVPEVLPDQPQRRFFPPMTSAFDTKDVGDRIEFESIWGEDGLLEARVDVSHSDLLRRTAFGKGKGRDEKPEFGTSLLRTGLTMQKGIPQLVGTVTPLDEKGRVWWAFVTVRGDD